MSCLHCSVVCHRLLADLMSPFSARMNRKGIAELEEYDEAAAAALELLLALVVVVSALGLEWESADGLGDATMALLGLSWMARTVELVLVVL